MTKLVEIICMHKEICNNDIKKLQQGNDCITYPINHPCHACTGYDYRCSIYQEYLEMVQQKLYRLD